MLNTLAKLTAVAVLAVGLAACDNKDDTKPAVPPPDTKPTVTQPAPPPPPAPVETPPAPPGLNVSLQKGKITFELPPGFSDQTLNSGIINDSTSTIQRFLDGKSRQSAVSSEVIPPDGMKLNTSDKMLKSWRRAPSGAGRALSEYPDHQRRELQRRQTEVSPGGYRADRQRAKVVSTLVLTVFNKRVVTLQMLSPAKTPEVHQALVQRIIDTRR
ncbi:DUF1795 domain-containing protein [Serratia ureilytica]